MGSLTSRVVRRLSALPPVTSSTYELSGQSYDYAIGGLPFVVSPNRERLLERVTAEFRKQQFDTSAEPGEQTLVSWWLRSQSSFHAGTGITYEEPDANFPNNVYRFQDSLGVDVWTAGQVTLLPAMGLNKSATGNVLLMGAVAAGNDVYYQAEAATLTLCVDGSTTPVTWGGSGTNITGLAQDGTNYYAANATGIYKGALVGGAGSLIWNTGSANVVLGWVKQRLIAGIGNKLYELDAAGTGGPTLPTPKYTHPDANWQWTSISETPGAILAAGFSGATSAVFKLILDTSTAAVPVTAAVSAAQMPTGELIYSLFGYLGDYVAIGTNKGVRIASVDVNGDLQYGPLSVKSTGPVRSLVGKDRFVYAAAENQLAGQSGVWRLDMGTTVAFRQFAYATDLQTHAAGAVRSVALFGSSGRLLVGVDGAGSYLEDPTRREPTGFLTTGRIRMHTLEPKLFKYVRYRGLALAGAVAVAVLDSRESESGVVSFSAAGTTPYEEGAMSSNLGPQEYVSLKFTFTRDTGNLNAGPTFTGYQLKALPATKRQRIFQLPLMCFDFEKDKNGNIGGGEGTAIERLEALEALEEAGDLVTLQDLGRHPTANHLCVIDQLRFVQDTTPTNPSGWGGYIYITLRSVT